MTTDTYDNPWKEAIETYFIDCLAFFFPQAATDIDWHKGYEFLDKELQQATHNAEIGERTVDKLIRVWRRSGQETWVLIHLEIQSQRKADFAERMYIYNYRLFDQYHRRIASFAILADDSPKWYPKHYGYELWGCKVRLDFPTVKLLEYRSKWEMLESSRNPFAVLVMAHLHTQTTRKDPDKRFELKWHLIKKLYEEGYTKRDVQLLFRFIDWLMALPLALNQKLKQRLISYEEENKVTYITSIEQLALEEGKAQGLKEGLQEGKRAGLQEGKRAGLQEGKKEGLQEGTLQTLQKNIIQSLKIRFGEIKEELQETIQNIKTIPLLETLFEKAVVLESIKAFETVLEQLLAERSQSEGVDSDSQED